MKVLLVTTWGIACGISEHSAYLKEAVEAADPEITVLHCPDLLDPYSLNPPAAGSFGLVHLNYHAALHSQWTAEAIRYWQNEYSVKVLVTYHDTGVPNSDQCKAIVDAADVTIIHEPAEDLPAEKVRYWRMGVPQAASVPVYICRNDGRPLGSWARPVLGSIGFPFPWKNYDQLARVTAEAGWGLLLIAPTATDTQIADWTALQPHLAVRRDFVRRHEAISLLAGCDATAFTYVCHNTGQSGAILQGIAARKPVIALRTCRQFRALFLDDLGNEVIRWCDTFGDVAYQLRHLCTGRVDPGIVALAERDGWPKLGRRYASLYKELIAV